MAIFFNMEELLGVCDSIPYPVESVVDPATIRFPCISKFILVQKPDVVVDDVAYDGVVYCVCVDLNDFQEFYAVLDARQRPGIEGYEYAESVDEAGSGSDETEAPAATE